jgi:N-acetyl-anhydromuramyl-L-alanine amidase AmpD
MEIIETNLNFNSNYSIRNGNPPGFVLHHAAANGSVYDVHNWHLANGWAGIGYHFYVRKDGSVYRGRPEDWIGSHTYGHNSKIGICAEGNFETDQMSAAQKNAIIELLEYLRGKYGNQPVYGHRDLDATACPGRNYPFNDIVNGKKEETEEKPDVKPVVDPNAVTITLTTLGNGDEGEQVKTLQRLLVYFGYALGDYGVRGDGVDGYFGSATENAVRKFQRENGLVEDGLVGEETWSCILGV